MFEFACGALLGATAMRAYITFWILRGWKLSPREPDPGPR